MSHTFGVGVVAMSLMLAGCAERVVYERRGGPASDFDVVDYRCTLEARVSVGASTPKKVGGGGFAAGMAQAIENSNARAYEYTDRGLHVLCMKAAGYSARRR